jgi:SAM-dependent methyltransferase
MARAATGCEVWHQHFLALALPPERFDGVFANAALFHVPVQELPRVLRELHATLKRQGVLFSSNPRGSNEEGWKGERYGAFHDLVEWRAPPGSGRFRRARALLPAARPAAGATTVARQCLAMRRPATFSRALMQRCAHLG